MAQDMLERYEAGKATLNELREESGLSPLPYESAGQMLIKDEIELKPCPFCGNAASFMYEKKAGMKFVRVRCYYCRAQMDSWIDTHEKDGGKHKAANAWNHRWADPNTRTIAEVHQIVEAVRAGIPMRIEYADLEEDAMDPEGAVYKPCW